MKVKVMAKYVDKNTGEIHDVGEVLDYPKERAEELIKEGVTVKYKPRTVTVKESSIS